MERVRKIVFDPLATSKARVREILEQLPVGSAHPFSPEQLLLCRTDNGIDEIDISSYSEDFFFNAVDIGEMGEILLRRMAGFKSHLEIFDEFKILQAPASTFKVPLVSDQVAILAISQKKPTYYDFCLADASYNTCCWYARHTFPGITHSGDTIREQDLLHYVKFNKDSFTEKEICVFISGFQLTPITKFIGTNPALLVADHAEKVLYIVPVPLDAATIGDATICCPLVIKRDGDSLICSILPTATTDRELSCSRNRLESASFLEAIKRADFTISATPQTVPRDEAPMSNLVKKKTTSRFDSLHRIPKENVVLATDSTTLPAFINLESTQVIRFGTGIEFDPPGKEFPTKSKPAGVVLPCIFGTQLQGPFLLATGTVPSNVPFDDAIGLQNYYNQCRNVVVVVDDRMTDNARNLANTRRINALFIVQLSPQTRPKDIDAIQSLLDSANINAVTALAGPQSLILIQIYERYYFYRGLANRVHVNTSKIEFGEDVTSILESIGIESLLEPRVEQIITLGDANSIILPSSGQLVQPQHLQKLFTDLSIDQIKDLEDDILAAVPQLQMLLNERELKELSKVLVFSLSAKISNAASPLRSVYTKFLTQEYKPNDPELVKQKNNMLGKLRKITKDTQTALEPLISNLANMMSSQTTSKRTHDLKRLVRQTQIQANVEATKSMTFDTLAGYLETYAGDMGVMLLNIETTSFSGLLSNLKSSSIDASSCCGLDPRVLHLEGFDAGIIIEQSQGHHNGPLRSEAGPSHPILALPYLSQESGTGSMLAWVCWDEFVNLKSPYSVRWMEKCNEAHIAALRIIMRSTLSQAVASRQYGFQPNSPETGHLMSALLMAAMSKLAAMRTTMPIVSVEAEDTVTKLMRGLFGNLLTTAGSGVRPLSMVWQLFGLDSGSDLPQTDAEWIWYESVVALYPYTGWPLKQFHKNLEKLLDKVIVRVVTKNESVEWVRANRIDELIKFSKLRNIQLQHSRTIITIFMRMLTAKDADIAAIATRLLERIPKKLERQSQGYTKMIDYLEHLARGGQRRAIDDIITASIYTSRSATFSQLKSEVAKAFEGEDWAELKKHCQEIVEKHAEIAALWHVNPKSFKVQNMNVYKDLLEAQFGDDISDATKTKNIQLNAKVLGDAETRRVPWQVGKKGQFGDDIEPLDEGFVHEILTGEKSESPTIVGSIEKAETTATAVIDTGAEDDFMQFKSMSLEFVTSMQEALSAEEVCHILNVPATAMRVFIKALNPTFVWEDLGKNFKSTIWGLLENRSGRLESCPVIKMLGLVGDEEKLQIDG